MASLLWTVLLICVAAPYLKADNKHVGEACTASDKCVDTGNICDSGTNKCAEVAADKVGHACAVDGDCTGSNMKCDTATSKECICNTGYSGPRNGDCAENKAGAACTTDADCPTASHLKCDTGTTKKCICDTGYSGAAGADCTEVAADKVGHACAVDGDCTGSNMKCDTATSKECICNTGYSGPRNGDCTSAQVSGPKKGDDCTAGTAAADCPSAKHLKCDTGKTKKCICADGYSGADCKSGSAALTSVTSLALVALFWASRHLLKE